MSVAEGFILAGVLWIYSDVQQLRLRDAEGTIWDLMGAFTAIWATLAGFVVFGWAWWGWVS